MVNHSKKFVPQRRTAPLDFTGTEFEGLQVDVNLSVPYGLMQAVAKDDHAAALELAPQLIADWNLCDPATGEILPVTPEGIGRAGLDILMTIFTKAVEQIQVGGLPKNG